MRVLIWLLFLFALAVGFTLAGKFDPGYAILVYPPYRIELSLLLFILLLVGVIVLGESLLRFASAIMRLPRQARDYRLRQRVRAGETALLRALRADLEQRVQDVEAPARQAIELGYHAELAALLAARAAQAMQDQQKSDHYRELARKF